MDAFGLSPKVANTIRQILADFPEVERAVIYGSRAKGTHKPGSDIDLTLFGDRLTSDTRARIAARLDDSPIPHTVDLSIYTELNHAKLREHIDRVGVVFYERGGAGVGLGAAGVKKGWERMRLGEVCDILDSQRKPITKRDRTVGEYPYYGATGIVDYVNEFIFDEPLVLVGEDGAKWGSGENTAFAIEGKCWVNNHAHVLRPHRKTVIDNWLVHYLNHSDLTEFVNGLTVPKLNQGSLREIPIPVPPLPEQRRIVALLDEAFAGLATAQANAEKNLQNARALFESHLNGVFTKRGEGWVETSIGDCIRFIDYRGKTPEKTTSGLRLITAKNVKMGFLQSEPEEFVAPESYDRWMTRGIPRKGDVLLTTEAPLANVAQLDTSDKVVFAQRIIIMQPDAARLDSTFLKYLLLSPPVQERIHASGTGATVKGIKASLLKRIAVFFPKARQEQHAIVATLDALSAETRRLAAIYERKQAALAALKKSLLHQAFAGGL